MSDNVLMVSAHAYGRSGHVLTGWLEVREHSVGPCVFVVDDDHLDTYVRISFLLGGEVRACNIDPRDHYEFEKPGQLTITDITFAGPA